MKTNQSQKNTSKWVEKELGEVASFFNGKAHENNISDNGKYVLINSKFVSTNGLVAKNTDTCLSPLKKGDVTMVMSDVPNGKAIAKCFLVDKDNKYTLNQRIGGFRSDEINSSFLYFLLNRNQYFLAFDDGVNQTNLRKDDILECPLYFPPLPEQNRIVSILETWDKTIQKLTRKIEIKKQIKKGLADAFILKSKNSKICYIEDLFDLGRGRVIARGEIEKNAGAYPVYSSQTSDDGVFGKINTYDFNGEYLTWTTDGANAGRVFYRNGKFNCTNVCGTAKLKAGLKVNLYFVASYLNYITKNYVSYVGNPKLMNGVFGNIEIKLPDYKEQTEIAEILNISDAEIAGLEKKISIIKEQKKYLLNNLITGAIRTPETLSAKS